MGIGTKCGYGIYLETYSHLGKEIQERGQRKQDRDTNRELEQEKFSPTPFVESRAIIVSTKCSPKTRSALL